MVIATGFDGSAAEQSVEAQQVRTLGTRRKSQVTMSYQGRATSEAAAEAPEQVAPVRTRYPTAEVEAIVPPRTLRAPEGGADLDIPTYQRNRARSDV